MAIAIAVKALPLSFVVHVLAIAGAVLVLVWNIYFRGGLAWESTDKSLIFNVRIVLYCIILPLTTIPRPSISSSFLPYFAKFAPRLLLLFSLFLLFRGDFLLMLLLFSDWGWFLLSGDKIYLQGPLYKVKSVKFQLKIYWVWFYFVDQQHLLIPIDLGLAIRFGLCIYAYSQILVDFHLVFLSYE